MHKYHHSVGMTLMSLAAVLALAGSLIARPAAAQDESEAVGNIFTQPPAPPGGKGKKPKPQKKEKAFQDVVKDMEKIEGLFTFYRKADENKVLIEILPEQFDKDYIASAKIEQATGERGLYGTIMMGEMIFQWRRLGKTVQFVEKNLRFRARPGSPAERAVQRSFTDSVLASGKVLSKPHPERKSVLVNLADIVVASDIHGLGSYLKQVYQGGYRLDKNNSGFVLVKSFPLNAEIGTVVQFRAQELRGSSVTIPDPRSVSVRFRYSLVALPENEYMPRLADDRLGYIMDQHMDFTSDRPDTPYVRYATRWHLKKKNPRAAVSEPVEPIVFWLENNIPTEYRDPLREGILMWNPVFEKAGFKNALVVKQQPDDADWDPADIRYNTIRWFVGYDAFFAIGPSHTNPYTGQIIDADIGFSEGLVRLVARRQYQRFVHPVQAMEELIADPPTLPSAWGQEKPRHLCTLGQGLTQLSTFALGVMATRPDWSPEKEVEYVRQFIAYVAAHEVGHTLGLRHNYRASQINSMDQLADTGRTQSLGQVASVMDYAAPFVAQKGRRQGDYFTRVAGPYDFWVIEYGYKPIAGARTPEEELPELRKIGARVADPMLPYATDEDAGYSPRALDPRNNHWDNAAEPLEYFSHLMDLVQELWANMEAKLLVPGESYGILRNSFNTSWGPYFLGSMMAMKYIGGIYHHRDHFGDPNGRPPYVPVPAAKQREALRFLAERVWASEVFQPSADLLNRLQFERFWDFQFSVFTTPRLDYPLHDSVLAAQANVLNSLYHPIKLGRLQDLEMKFPDPDDRFTMADMFIGIRQAIWSELAAGTAINSFRRNLQRAHLNHLIRMVVRPAAGTPEDGVTLARADLVELGSGIERVLSGSQLDYTSRAHLEETRARIQQALEARLQRGM